MKSIAKLRDEARKHEQKEDWDKAIAAYVQVLELGEQGDGSDLDLPLYNRVGDLYVRVGRTADAVTYYARAADRYAEAGLYNNAIALCNKALRYDANRLDVLRKLGSFSASQGFYTDARRWYLEYAEKSIKKGELDEAFAALTDLADVNDDPETRELLAVQLRAHDRKDRAIEEFKRAYALRVAAGEQSEADRIRAQIVQLDPAADMTQTHEAPQHHAHAYETEQLPGFMDKAPAAAPPPPVPPVREPPKPQATDDPIEIEQTGVQGGLDVDANMGFESINIESGFTGADNANVETFDIGLEQPLGITPEEALDESGDFELPTFETEESIGDAFEPLDMPTFDDYGAETEAEEEEEEATELPGFADFSTEIESDIQPETPGFASFGSLESPATEEPAAGPPPEFDSGMGQGGDLDLTGEGFFTELPSLEEGLVADMGSDATADLGLEPEAEFASDVTFGAGPEAGLDVEEEAAEELAVELETGFDEELATEFEEEADDEFADQEPDAEFELELEPEGAADLDSPAADVTEFEPDAEPVAPEPDWLAEFVSESEAAAAAESEEELASSPVPELEPAVPPEPEPEPVAEWEPEPEPAPEPEPEPEPLPEPEPVPAPEPPEHYVPAPEPEPAPAPVAEAPKPKKDKEYVDLASFLEDDEDEAEDSTRFVVAEKAPTGDEEKDFADMLAQFKQKVAETIPKEDAGSHYDLGIAFKEMGLIDEAIGEFQTALRAGQEKLKVYEELGSCFVMKQQYSVAITVLNRASALPYTDETELLGVYYNLGRAHEELGQPAEARSAYEKIVAIDIGFRDTTARIARL